MLDDQLFKEEKRLFVPCLLADLDQALPRVLRLASVAVVAELPLHCVFDHEYLLQDGTGKNLLYEGRVKVRGGRG